MKPDAALSTLLEQSSRVESAVVFERSGTVVASTIDDKERAQRLATSGRELLSEAERRRPDRSSEPLAQLEVALPGGSAFVVQDGERLIAATTGPEPTVGLVFYDLKKCLRDLGDEKVEKPKRRARTTKAAAPKKKAAPRKKKGDAGS